MRSNSYDVSKVDDTYNVRQAEDDSDVLYYQPKTEANGTTGRRGLMDRLRGSEPAESDSSFDPGDRAFGDSHYDSVVREPETAHTNGQTEENDTLGGSSGHVTPRAIDDTSMNTGAEVSPDKAVDEEEMYDTSSNMSVESEIPKTRWGRTKRWMRKHKFWTFIIISAPITLVILLIVFLVIIPAVAQDALNGADLQITQVVLTNPDAENGTIDARVVGTVSGAGSFAANTKAAPLTIYNVSKKNRRDADNSLAQSHNPDDIIGQITLPPLEIRGGSAGFNVTAQLQIPNGDAFNTAAKEIVEMDEIEWEFYVEKLDLVAGLGSPVLHINGLHMDKMVKMAGMGGLSKVNIEKFDMTHSNQTSVNSMITLSIDNPSVFSMDPVGILELDMYYEGKYLGTGTTTSTISMVEGKNTMGVFAPITPEAGSNKQVAELFSKYVSGKSATVTAKANPKKPTNIPFYAGALDGYEVTTVLHSNIDEIVDSIDLHTIDLNPNDDKSFHLTSNAQAVLAEILGPNASMNITKLSFTELNMVAMSDDGDDDKIMATIVADDVPAKQVNNTTIDMPLNNVLATIEDKKAFVEFANELVASENYNGLGLNAIGDFLVELPIGQYNLTGINFTKRVPLKGLNNLDSLKVTKVELPGDVKGKGKGLLSATSATLDNTSPMQMDMRKVILGLKYNDVIIGEIGPGVDVRLNDDAKNLVIGRGQQSLALNGAIVPKNNDEKTQQVFGEFFSKYINNEALEVEVVGLGLGGSETEQIDWLSEIVQGISTKTTIQGIVVNLIQNLTLTAVDLDVPPADSKAGALLGASLLARYHNPFGISLGVAETAFKLQVANYGTLTSDTFKPVDSDTGSVVGLSFEKVPLMFDGKTGEEAFTDFVIKTLKSSESTLETSGDLDIIAVMNLPFRVTLTGVKLGNQSSSFEGFNNLPGTVVSNINLPHDTKNGIALTCDATISNPSIASASLGAVNFDIFYKDVNVGTVTANTSLKAKGKSTLSLNGEMIKVADEHLPLVSEFMSRFIAGDLIDTQVRGASTAVRNDGWAGNAVRALTLDTTLPGQKLSIIQTMQIDALSLDVDQNKGTAQAGTTGATATYKLPYGFSTEINQVKLDCGINPHSSKSRRDGGNPDPGASAAAEIISGWVDTKDKDHTLSISGFQGALEVHNSDQFASVVHSLVFSETAVFDMIGTTDAKVTTNIGQLTLTGVSLGNAGMGMKLKGMNGLKDVTINSLDLPGQDKDSILVVTNATIMNPSETSVNLGPVNFEILYKGVKLGEVVSEKTQLLPNQKNSMSLTGHIKPDLPADFATVSEFFTRYTQNLSSPATVRGLGGAGPHVPSWLAPTVAQLSLNASVPGYGSKLDIIKGITFDAVKTIVAENGDTSFVVQGSAKYENPFKFDLGVAEIRMHAGIDDDIASMDMADFAKTTYSKPTEIGLDITTPVKVNKLQPWIDLVSNIVLGTEFDFGVSGTTDAMVDLVIGTVQINGLALDVPKITPIAGMHGFAGEPVIIENFNIPGDVPNGIGLNVEASLVNPSPVTMELHSATFDVLYNDATVGRLTSTPMIIKGGIPKTRQDMNMTGWIAPISGDSALPEISEFFSEYVQGNPAIPTSVKGYTASGAGKNNEWIAPVLQKVVLKTSMKGDASFNPIKGVTTTSVDAHFGTGRTNPTMSMKVDVDFQNPFHFDLVTEQYQINADLSYNGKQFGSIAVDKFTKVDSATTTDIKMTISSTLNVTSPEDNIAFTRSILVANNTEVSMVGTFDAIAKTRIGVLTIKGVNMQKVGTSIKSMGGLGIVEAKNMLVQTSDKVGLDYTVDSHFSNPSIVSTTIEGDTVMNVGFLNGTVGTITLTDFNLPVGDSISLSKGKVWRSAGESANALFSQYILGPNIPLVLSAPDDDSGNWVQQALRPPASLHASLDSINQELVQKTSIKWIKHLAIKDTELETYLTSYNPLNVPITLNSATANLNFHDSSTQMAVMDNHDLGYVIPANGTAKDQVIVTAFNKELPRALIDVLAGGLYVDILEGKLGIDVVGFPVTLDYHQDDVKVGL
eukprot:Clim_evm90s25 gene=Clim_evmTU90s25